MATVTRCDLCGKETEQIVGKLFYAPTNRAVGSKSFHNNYQLHADVGICCESGMKRAFKWRQRMTAAMYRARGGKKKAAA